MIAQIERCSCCDAEIGEHGHCNQCGHDQGEPAFLGESMPKSTAEKHRQAVLDARKIIDFLRSKRDGATSAEIRAGTGIHGGLVPYAILEKHNLVEWAQGKPRIWYAKGGAR